MAKVNDGIDMISRALGDPLGASYMTGTSTTAPTATTFPMDGATMPSASSGGPPHNAGALIGKTVVRAGVCGVILQHSATAATGLTIDKWHDPTNPNTTASTPAAGQWVIVPGGYPACWMGLSVATRAIAAVSSQPKRPTGQLATPVSTRRASTPATRPTGRRPPHEATSTNSPTSTTRPESARRIESSLTRPASSTPPRDSTAVTGPPPTTSPASTQPIAA